MMRWLLLLIAFPLLSHAAVERLVTSAEMSLRSFMPFTRRRARWRGTAPAAGPGGAKVPDVGYLRQLNAEGSSRYARSWC